MNEKKVSLGTVICIVIIFILIIVLGAMYVYYNYIPRKDINNMVNTNEDAENLNVNNMQSTTDLDINSKLVEKLYKYILKFNYYDETLVYQVDKVTTANLDNQIKLLTAFENLDESEAKKVKTTDLTGVADEDGNSYKYLYKKEVVEQKVKEIFGVDATVIHENCSPYDGHSRIYENGIYTCYDYAGGGDVPWSESRNQLVKAETDGNNIYLYDNYLHMVRVDNIINGVDYGGTVDIYATSDRKILMAKKFNLEENGAYDGTDNLTQDEFAKVYINNISKSLGENLVKTYKHTFTKDTNGNYYWVSTEIVD